jgi:hypothetical protein
MSRKDESLAMDAIDHLDTVHEFLDLLMIGLEESQSIDDELGADRLHRLTLVFLQLGLPELQKCKDCLEKIAKTAHSPFNSPATRRVGLTD